jgi:hypothetical protein
MIIALAMKGITQMIEVLEQALKAFEVATTPLAKDRQEVLEAVKAIKQAIAELESQEPVAFLANGTRFKLSMDDEGKVNCFWNQKELDGRWVALVAAEDDCHLNLTHPPQRTEQEPVAVYGYCPECEAKGVMRERRPDGNDKCAKGHTYPSSKATTAPQRTWVGLTDEEICMFSMWLDDKPDATVFTAIEARLKELNT